MTENSGGPVAWLAALTVEGEWVLRDVGMILDGCRDRMLSTLRGLVTGHVDTVRIYHRAGDLRVYFHEVGPAAYRLPRNRHARRVLERLGMDLGSYHGTFLFLGCDGDREVGLSEPQVLMLRELLPATSAR